MSKTSQARGQLGIIEIISRPKRRGAPAHVPREIHGTGFPSESLAPGLNCGAPGGLAMSGREKEGMKTAARECARARFLSGLGSKIDY